MKKFFVFMGIACIVGITILIVCNNNSESTHNHVYEFKETVQPTCDHAGYDKYVCEECGEIDIRNTISQLPHNYSDDVITTASTCEERGFSKKICQDCGHIETFGYTNATGHDPAVIEGRAPTCTESGLSNSETCKKCGKHLKESVEINALGHNRRVAISGVEATCSSTGLTDKIDCSVCGAVLQEQEVTPISHTDGDSDGFCDKCRILLGDDVVEISNAEQLKNISFNLNGEYKLAADITLPSTWSPIGTAAAPFTGKLDGSNHRVCNLSGSGSLAGLFGYNSGSIRNLVIDGFNYVASYSRSQWDYASGQNLNYGKETSIAGAVCAVNSGTVINCTLTGTVSIEFSTSFVLGVKNPYPTGSAYYELSVGGLVGKNNGLVEECSAGGVANFTYRNTAEYYVDRGFFTGMQLGAGYKKFINSMTVNYGVLIGHNAGNAVNCTVSTSRTYSIAIKAYQDGFGNAIAENNLNLGSGIGYNSGRANNVSGSTVSVSPYVSLSATPPWNGSVGEYCQAVNNMVLNTGKNTGGVIGNE